MSAANKKAPRFELKVDGLAEGALQVHGFEGHEGLSQPFCYELQLFSEAKAPVNPADVQEKQAHLIWKWMDPPRLVHGIITGFRGVGRPPPQADGKAAASSAEEAQEGEQRGFRYTALLVPPMAQLAHQTSTRVFNAISTPDIVKQVLAEAKQELGAWKLKETYLKRAHCTQYQESSLRFLGRILAQDGLCYFFDHEASPSGQSRLIVADQNEAFRKLPGIDAQRSKLTGPAGPFLRYVQPTHSEQGVGQYQQLAQPGARAFATSEPDPDASEHGGSAEGRAGTDKLLSSQALGATYQVVLPPTTAKAKRAQGKGVPQPEDGISPELVARLNTVRAESAKTQQNLASGQSNCDRLAAGMRFTLRGFPDQSAQDFELLVVQVRHVASSDPAYGNAFVAFPVALGSYRPPQSIAKPQAAGVGTAKCVSSSGEEGAPLFLPRAGDEVVIVYENGDPDRPLALGSVYNSANTAHLLATTPIGSLAKGTGAKTLQANRNVAGLRCGANELALSDAASGPLLYLKAQDQMCIEVTGSQTTEVKGDQTEIVGGSVKIMVTGSVTITAKAIVLNGGASTLQLDDAGIKMKGKVVGLKASSGGSIDVAGGKINLGRG
ncbi:MAG: hypothetical protein IPL40_06175 [Proteobacteria bacterium]|nr:hypothetical protein [Pseudomonadota bacterium]